MASHPFVHRAARNGSHSLGLWHRSGAGGTYLHSDTCVGRLATHFAVTEGRHPLSTFREIGTPRDWYLEELTGG